MVYGFQIRFVRRLQNFDEGFLRDVDFPDAFHPLFSFFLFLQQFALAGDVASVAFTIWSESCERGRLGSVADLERRSPGAASLRAYRKGRTAFAQVSPSALSRGK